jgi:hypothetical protein
VAAHFGGGAVSSDGGVLLLRQADRRLGLTAGVAAALGDERRAASCAHHVLGLLRQRVYALALGYEDLNDHATLRADPGLQTAVERDVPLASSPTLCRWENRADRETAWAIHRELVERFIASYTRPPRRLILDFDATDDAVHGNQEGRFFHGYYGQYCFLPLYVFCGGQLLVSYLRPSSTDPARHVWAILALLVQRLRQAWPEAEIVFRGDSHFCRWRLLRWCERHGVGYIVGLAKNPRVQAEAADLMAAARSAFEGTGQKQRLFADVVYAALTWDQPRRVIAKAEHGDLGSNPRFVVTNLDGEAQTLYDTVYCARGEMENRIKEQQLDLFADRTSCHRWWPNQFRLLLSSLAYTLLEAIRRLALQGTELARAQCRTIRLKLLKIGAVVVRNTRRVRFILSSGYPLQALFFQVAARLAVSDAEPLASG